MTILINLHYQDEDSNRQYALKNMPIM